MTKIELKAKRLDGKVALVTGGTSGIGLATAQRFEAEGAHVIITGRRQAELDAAVALIGGRITGVRADSARLDELDALYARISAEHGHLDVLFANAGGGSWQPLGAITEDQYEQVFASNVKGVLFTVQKALPLLAEGASVIVNGSTTSIGGAANFSVYSASKAAVRNFVRSWILDLKGRGIRVNTLSPGPTRTNGLARRAGTDTAAQDAMFDTLAKDIPLGRVAQPEEIAAVAAFLASSDASFVNGIELFVDGGFAQV